MFFRCFVMLLVCLSMISNALADVKHMAVLEFRGVGIDTAYLLKLSDQSRRAAVELLPKKEYLIMTRENMQQMLSDMDKDLSCLEGVCEVEIGRNVGAEIIITGDLLKIENTYVLTLKLYDTISGALLSTRDVEGTDLLSLKRDTYAESRTLLQDGLKIGSPTMSNPNVGFQGTVKSDNWFVAKEDTVIIHYTSSPEGAVVLVDGQLICSATPCSKEVAKGSHQVIFQKERYFPYQTSFDTGSQQQLNAELEPQFGILNIEAENQVRVLLNDEPLGRTPIRSYELDAGMYTLGIDDPCYVGQNYRFVMKPGTTEDVQYPIEMRESAISVRASDKGGNDLSAKVTLDGKDLGVTPLQEKVPLCSKQVRVTSQGEVQSKTVSLKEREISEVEVVFYSAKNNTGMKQQTVQESKPESIEREEMANLEESQRTPEVLIGRRTKVSSGALMGVSLVLYGATVSTYNQFYREPSEELYKLNHRVHTGGILCTTVAVGIFVNGLVRDSKIDDTY